MRMDWTRDTDLGPSADGTQTAGRLINKECNNQGQSLRREKTLTQFAFNGKVHSSSMWSNRNVRSIGNSHRESPREQLVDEATKRPQVRCWRRWLRAPEQLWRQVLQRSTNTIIPMVGITVGRVSHQICRTEVGELDVAVLCE